LKEAIDTAIVKHLAAVSAGRVVFKQARPYFFMGTIRHLLSILYQSPSSFGTIVEVSGLFLTWKIDIDNKVNISR